MAKVHLFPDGMTMPEEISVDDFSAYMPQHSYIFRPTGEMWSAAGVNARIPPILENGEKVKANRWIDQNAPVEQMTWWPGEALDIKDRLVNDGGWFAKPGATVFNLYRPATIKPKKGNVARWTNHVVGIYGDYAEHIISWLAQRVQDPGTKINHALVLGGEPGIGKDTILEPIKHAIGEWNFAEVSPVSMLERFNSHLKSVILRISEAHDRGDRDRYAFYERTKTVLATPPNTMTVDEKNIKQYRIPNVCGVIMTTNRKDALYLTANDRRHYITWSDKTQGDFTSEYWDSLYYWYEHEGGYEAIAHYLNEYDLTGFNPKASPPKTQAFWEMTAAASAPENVDLMNVLEQMGMPDATTIDKIRQMATGHFLEWLQDRNNRKQYMHRFGDCGYTSVTNPDNKQGFWTVSGSKCVVYAKADLVLSDRMRAASLLRQT